MHSSTPIDWSDNGQVVFHRPRKHASRNRILRWMQTCGKCETQRHRWMQIAILHIDMAYGRSPQGRIDADNEKMNWIDDRYNYFMTMECINDSDCVVWRAPMHQDSGAIAYQFHFSYKPNGVNWRHLNQWAMSRWRAHDPTKWWSCGLTKISLPFNHLLVAIARHEHWTTRIPCIRNPIEIISTSTCPKFVGVPSSPLQPSLACRMSLIST